MKKAIFFSLIILLGFTSLSASPTSRDQLVGTWVATVEYNRSFDTYRINLSADGSCVIKMTNDRAEQETTGNWSWDGTMLRINAIFRNARITYQNHIQWTSVVNFIDNNAFNIVVRPAVNGSLTRFTFFRQEGFDEQVIKQAFDSLCEHIPLRSRIAIINISASDPAEENYYLDELTLLFVNSRRYTIVDRRDINAVLAEQDFQLSGYVDDDEIVSIGKFLSANVVITGNISGTGSQKRLVIKAIDVLTGEILAMSPISL
ncbi:MAG: CsgG/HfaB family protein [Treponema sp.]|nr:CsgG/HfaB family protein [Treponema sp.]